MKHDNNPCRRRLAADSAESPETRDPLAAIPDAAGEAVVTASRCLPRVRQHYDTGRALLRLPLRVLKMRITSNQQKTQAKVKDRFPQVVAE